MRNDNKDETTEVLNDHSERINQLTKWVDMLFAQPLAHQKLPPSPIVAKTSNLGVQGTQAASLAQLRITSQCHHKSSTRFPYSMSQSN